MKQIQSQAERNTRVTGLWPVIALLCFTLFLAQGASQLHSLDADTEVHLECSLCLTGSGPADAIAGTDLLFTVVAGQTAGVNATCEPPAKAPFVNHWSRAPPFLLT